MTDRQLLRERFLDETYSSEKSSNAQLQQNFPRWVKGIFWEKVAAVENKLGKHLEDGYSREDFLKLFAELNVSQIGSMYEHRSVIQRYLKWLRSKGFDGETNSKTLREIKYEELEYGDAVKATFFKDFNSLDAEIEKAVIRADKINDDVHDLPISLIYLAWYGVTIEEVCTIRKEDLNELSDTVYIPSTSRTVKISGKVMDFLVSFRDSDGYLTQAAREIKLKYKDSPLLIRTAKSTDVTINGIKNILVRFSRHPYPDSNVKFMYSRIRLSGMFNRAYANELVNGTFVKNDYERLAEVFGETYKDYHDASDRLREYNNWKSMFYPKN